MADKNKKVNKKKIIPAALLLVIGNRNYSGCHDPAGLLYRYIRSYQRNDTGSGSDDQTADSNYTDATENGRS